MKSLESLIPLSFAEAIGTTLLHSLWQLSALALLLMLVLAILPTGAVKWRYWSATFMVSALPTQFPALDEAKGVLETPSATMEGGNSGIFERITSAVQNNSYLFSGIWMMGVLFFSLRFLGGYWQVSRLRKRNLEEVPEELLQRFSILQEKLGLRRKIGIGLSSAINTPMVIGVLKPLVLLPAGLMSGLTMEQVECILVHELAHVRRAATRRFGDVRAVHDRYVLPRIRGSGCEPECQSVADAADHQRLFARLCADVVRARAGVRRAWSATGDPVRRQ